MKRFLMLLSTILFTVGLLLGCSSTEESAPEESSAANEEDASEVAEETITVTISKDEGEEVIAEEEIEIDEGDILMDVMKDNFDIEEDGGFINSIDGVAPEEDEEKSWIYSVNDEMAMVGADEYELEADDDVVFDLQPWE